jgi:TrmH family RNA methyltransferase
MDIGKHNRKLVELRKAVRQASLTSDGLLPIEGPVLLEEAQRSGIEIVDVFVRMGTRIPDIAATEVHEIPADVFKTIQDTEHSQGVIATVRPHLFNLVDILNTAPALVVILGRLQDPGNVGTILRISESFGATGCIGVRGSAAFTNSKVVRASAGSVFRLPHAGGIALKEAVEALRAKQISVVGTAPTADMTIEKWDWRNPAAILIGNEGGGLSAEELGYCDTVLRIPHKETVESLNSAVATAVTLYEASKQRR